MVNLGIRSAGVALMLAGLSGCSFNRSLPLLTESGCVRGNIVDGARYATNPRLKKAFSFLQRADLSMLTVGRYEIDGEDVFALVQECELKPVCEMKVEAHRKFIDIQAPLSGPEVFGVGRLSNSNFSLPFDEQKDVGFYSQTLDAIVLQPGEFVMFVPPYCAHGPCCTFGEPRRIKKVVVKVRK